MTRNGQKISFTQLVKTTTTPIKRRNLLKLCLSAPLREITARDYDADHGCAVAVATERDPPFIAPQ